MEAMASDIILNIRFTYIFFYKISLLFISKISECLVYFPMDANHIKYIKNIPIDQVE